MIHIIEADFLLNLAPAKEHVRIKMPDLPPVELSPKTKLELLVKPEMDDNEMISLPSELVAFISDIRQVVTVPLLDETAYLVNVHQKVAVKFYTKSAILSFGSIVEQRVGQGANTRLLLERVSDYHQIQRRQDFRLDCLMGVEIEYGARLGGSMNKLTGILKDVSGGGVSVQLSQCFDIGTPVIAYLPFGKDGEIIRFSCEVRRCICNEGSNNFLRYNVGLRIIFDSNSQQEMLISQIFKMQSRRIR